ncbi:Acyl-CoA N-acyltransferase [Beauveria brongniartii RCEF 3172]|uniref:Acyl-CoA N-acyltransferase n=1 Tax=Beauveria brongniartii RCEF 3172 TaxID=1081107 RepID=A0A167GFN7_9HYPO|nr:Acyl-CoA N-acyltransferase [Beauveria brongniartii RCEF 3172]
MTIPSLSLRKVTPETLPAIHALVESSFRGRHAEKGWCSEAEFFTSARITPEDMLAKLNSPGTTLLAGYDSSTGGGGGGGGGALVTCCEIAQKQDSDSDSKTCYFGLFAVDPERQGGGIGSFVLGEAERYARDELGCTRMEMQVIDRRDTLIAYYVRRGYVQTKETRPFPYELFGEGTVLRDDLRFTVLVKELAA